MGAQAKSSTGSPGIEDEGGLLGPGDRQESDTEPGAPDHVFPHSAFPSVTLMELQGWEAALCGLCGLSEQEKGDPWQRHSIRGQSRVRTAEAEF